jgi:pimeloyl-ACP methyl ester carboxylesterase
MWIGPRQLEGATCEEFHIDVDDGISLRVLRWTPIKTVALKEDPVVVIPGWGSVFIGWEPLLAAWVKRRPIIYIETREKGGTHYNRKVRKSDFQMHKYGLDLLAVIEHFKLNSSKLDWFSASMGSTIILDAYQSQILGARSSLMLAPNTQFNFPWWSKILIKLPLPIKSFEALRFIAVRVVTGKVTEEGQKIRYQRTLMAQNIRRLVYSARINIDYEMNLEMGHVKFPIGLMTAKSDHLHGSEDVEKLEIALPNGRIIEVLSNQHLHEAASLPEIEDFFSKAIA